MSSFVIGKNAECDRWRTHGMYGVLWRSELDWRLAPAFHAGLLYARNYHTGMEQFRTDPLSDVPRRTRIYNTASILIPMAGWKKMSKFAWIFQEIDQIALHMGNGDVQRRVGLDYLPISL